MSHSFRKKWLKFAATVVGLFGVMFFFGSMTATSEPVRCILDLVSWPLDGNHSLTDPTARFVSALSGGVLVGWGAMILVLSGDLYDARPEGVRKAILFSALAWYLVDSAGSITSGNATNAIFNILLLLLVVGPFWTASRN